VKVLRVIATGVQVGAAAVTAVACLCALVGIHHFWPAAILVGLLAGSSVVIIAAPREGA
jgi:hypothetical protein